MNALLNREPMYYFSKSVLDLLGCTLTCKILLFCDNGLSLNLHLCLAGELVAQFKFTLLLMPNGPMKITGLSFDESLYESEYSVTDEEMKVACCILYIFQCHGLLKKSSKILD